MKHMAIMGLMLAFTFPAAPAEPETRQDRQAREIAQRQAQVIREIKERKREAERRTLERFFGQHYVRSLWDERHVGPVTRQEFDRRQEAAERDREAAERDRQEREREKARVAAIPPEKRLASALCREADSVMAMAVDVARYDTTRHASVGTIIRDRRYYPAAPAEVALKLSRLARNLRDEAALWGSPCD